MKGININSVDKFNASQYPDKGVYRNTDETGIVDVMVVVKVENMVWSFSESSYNNFLDAINFSNDIDEKPKTNTVSEDFALKTITLILGNESYNDIK